jgi:hypothetical protein
MAEQIELVSVAIVEAGERARRPSRSRKCGSTFTTRPVPAEAQSPDASRKQRRVREMGRRMAEE